jgi:hypothetical protein
LRNGRTIWSSKPPPPTKIAYTKYSKVSKAAVGPGVARPQDDYYERRREYWDKRIERRLDRREEYLDEQTRTTTKTRTPKTAKPNAKTPKLPPMTKITPKTMSIGRLKGGVSTGASGSIRIGRKRTRVSGWSPTALGTSTFGRKFEKARVEPAYACGTPPANCLLLY